ncbi:WXG100 family type VII secretion target [Williamsia sp. MIQD14]|uniref:WXG100 family type VII secretion target n=1 Tax=Williamsia sp. MIQD14 TaxID=3425703 RepID=UPI003DA02E5B
MTANAGGADFEVQLPALPEAVDTLGRFRDSFTDMITECEHKVMALGSDWSGEARDAQVAFFRKLAEGMRTVDEGLAQFRRGVDDSHTHYSRAISTNLSMWQG